MALAAELCKRCFARYAPPASQSRYSGRQRCAGAVRLGAGVAVDVGGRSARRCGGGAAAAAACRSRRQGVRVLALDAAQPFDMEEIQKKRVQLQQQRSKLLTIGIVGFGGFGQFLAKRMVKAGHRVLATSRGDYSDIAKQVGAEFYSDVDDFCEEHPEVVILSTSILSTDKVLSRLPMMRLKRSTLIVDVLSVKVFPKQLLLERLEPHFDILCTHPMFGPTSGAGSWKGLNFQYEKVRINADPSGVRARRVEKLLQFFADEGCAMVEMTCEDHDYMAASTQFITHTVGRMLGTMKLKPTPINTQGYEALLNLIKNTNADSFDLYYGLFLYNQNATEELERLEKGFEAVKKSLFSKLHDIARAEMFPDGMEPPGPPLLPGEAWNEEVKNQLRNKAVRSDKWT